MPMPPPLIDAAHHADAVALRVYAAAPYAPPARRERERRARVY
jgi:hypothetical protein